MQHFTGHGKHLIHDFSRAFFLSQIQSFFPAFNGHYLGDFFGKLKGIFIPVFHAHHSAGRTQTQITHTMAALVHNFFTLLRQRQAVNFYHIVQHTGKNAHGFTECVPVKRGFISKGFVDKTGQVNRT